MMLVVFKYFFDPSTEEGVFSGQLFRVMPLDDDGYPNAPTRFQILISSCPLFYTNHNFDIRASRLPKY